MWSTETDRLLLRNWLEQDADSYLVLSRDIGYNCFSPPGHFLVHGKEEAREKIRERMRLFEEQRLGKFPIFLKESGEFAGTCGMEPFQLDGRPEVELGYRLCLKHWGKGYAVEAGEAILQYAFSELKRDAVWAFVLPQNRPSLRVLEKLRFKYRWDILHAEQWHRLYTIDRDRHLQDDPGSPL